jgi:hypothetical protein
MLKSRTDLFALEFEAYLRGSLHRREFETNLDRAREMPWFAAAADFPDEVYPLEDYAWWRSVMDFDPASYWRQMRVPLLLLKGESDDRSDAKASMRRILEMLPPQAAEQADQAVS